MHITMKKFALSLIAALVLSIVIPMAARAFDGGTIPLCPPGDGYSACCKAHGGCPFGNH